MTIVSFQNHHFSGAYAQVSQRDPRSGNRMSPKDGIAADGCISPFPIRTGFQISAPDCKRTDSGYYSNGSVHSPRSENPPPHSPRISSLSPHVPISIQTPSVLSPYKMNIVSTPPLGTSQEIDELFGPNSSAASISERELASNPLHPKFLAKYAIKGELGAGATGFVVAATRLEDDVQVAVKFMYKDRIPVTHWLRDRQLGGTVPLEIFILKRLNHPSIVKFLDLFQDKKFFYMVMETHGLPHSNASRRSASAQSPTTLRQHTAQQHTVGLRRSPAVPRRHSQDLFDCIEQNPCMPESDVHHIFLQIASAIAHLHANNIVHRDIKDENVVVDERLNVKLIDFGNAAYVPREQADHFDRFYGTMHCAPPEILRGELYSGKPQDIWSLGVLLYTLAFNQAPFKDAREIAEGRWAEPIFDRSQELLQVLAMCLDTNVATRATVQQILESEWVVGPLPTVVF